MSSERVLTLDLSEASQSESVQTDTRRFPPREQNADSFPEGILSLPRRSPSRQDWVAPASLLGPSTHLFSVPESVVRLLCITLYSRRLPSR